jgi:TetR/AcrR family transcriptional regulator, cholesterol catabolism regulator
MEGTHPKPPHEGRRSDRAPISTRSREGDLPRRICLGAVRLFAECGYAATSMRDIADAASCTKPALYYHFASKQDLFVQVLRSELDKLFELVEAPLAEPLSVRQRMVNAAEAYLAHARRNPLTLKLLMRAEMHPERDQPAFDFTSGRQRMMEKVTRLLDEGVAASEIRSDVDVMVTLDVLGGALDSRVMLWVLQGESIPEHYPAQLIDLVFRGLAAS